MNNNLKKITEFIKSNDNYSDYNFVKEFLFKLNFTKIKLNQNGGRTNLGEIETEITNNDKLINIKEGTILFHTSLNKKNSFNNQEIINLTSNYKVAFDKINNTTNKNFFINAFEVKKDINNILIKSLIDIKDINLDYNFLNENSYSGFVFYYPKNEIEFYNSTNFNKSNSEFILCNLQNHLEYLYSNEVVLIH